MSNYEYITNYRNKNWNENLKFKKAVALAMLTNSPIQNLTRENIIQWLDKTDSQADRYHYEYLAVYKLNSPVIFNRKTINKFNRELKSKNIRFREDSFDLMTNPSKNDTSHWNRHQFNNNINDWHRNTLVMLEKQKYLTIKEITTKELDEYDARENYFKVETEENIYFRPFQTQRRDGCHFSDVYDWKFVGKSSTELDKDSDDDNISYEYLVINGRLNFHKTKTENDYIWNRIEKDEDFIKLSKFFNFQRTDIFVQHPDDNDFLQDDEAFKNLIKTEKLEQSETSFRRDKSVRVLPIN